MNKQLLIFTFISIFWFGCKKQKSSNYPEYYKLYNKVLKLEKADRIEEAFQLFQKAEKLVEFIPVQHLLSARSYAYKLQDCNLTLDYFQKAVNNGLEYQNYNYNPELCNEIDNTSVTELKFDYEYKNEVAAIYSSDQAIRNSSDKDNMKEIDSINIEILLSLIERKGYPNSRVVGNKTANNAFIVLLHYDSDIGNRRLRPLLNEAYNQGMLSPENYAWIVDRRRFWGPDRIEPYFYQLPSKKYFEMTVEEIAIIDARRDSIGLKPLSEMGIRKTENGGISITNTY